MKADPISPFFLPWIFEMIGLTWKKQLPLMKSLVPVPYPPNVTYEMNGITDVINARCSCVILGHDEC